MTDERRSSGLIGSRSGFVLLAFLAIGGYFLWSEHRAHTMQFLAYGLLLLCPLMHLFHGHGGHGGHGHKDGPGADDRKNVGADHAGHGADGDRR